MALNTRNNRASAIGFLHPSVRVFPNPDGSLAAQADRQQVNWTYAAIAVLPLQGVTARRVSRPQDQHLLTVIIEPPLGITPRYRLDSEDINPYLTGARWRTVMPGGWSEFEVGIDRPDKRYRQPLAQPYLTRELRWTPFAHIVVRRGSATVFEGRIGPIKRPGGQVRAFTAQGYGLAAVRDDYYRSDDTTDSTTGAIIREMVASVAPQLRIAPEGWFDDPLITHDAVDFDMLYLADALDQLVSEGDGRGNLMDWWIYEGQQLTVKPRVAPEAPHYQLPFDHRVTDWTEDPSQIVGRVTYERLSSGSPTPSTTDEVNPDFTDDYGVQRGAVLKLGEISESQADEFRKTYLMHHSRPLVSGAVEIGPDDVLPAPGGRIVPAWRARAGEWIQVGNEPMQMISGTEFDATSRVLRMTIGEQPLNMQTMLARLERDRRRARYGINPYGGRAR